MGKRKNIFNSCPLCKSRKVRDRLNTIDKDMSQSGFKYIMCYECGTYYLCDVTLDVLNTFYASLDAYDSTSSKSEIINELAQALKLTGEEHVLDLGCGSGNWTLPMLSYCCQITCVDLNSDGLNELENNVPFEKKDHIKCYNEDGIDFLSKCDNHSFDIILNMWSLEHSTKPQQLLSEIYRVLKPGGSTVVLVPSADSLQLKLLSEGFYWFQAPWHTFIPSNRGLKYLADKVGYSTVKILELDYPFYSWFWIRGLADRFRLRKFYDTLRNFKSFIRFDIAIDEILDRISFLLKRPSYVFFIFTRYKT
jgi:ubiquinone/menaquinone biosynthesis C-methylase UbiE